MGMSWPRYPPRPTTVHANELAKVPPPPPPPHSPCSRIITVGQQRQWPAECCGRAAALRLAGGWGHRALAVCASAPCYQGQPSHSEDPQPPPGTPVPRHD